MRHNKHSEGDRWEEDNMCALIPKIAALFGLYLNL